MTRRGMGLIAAVFAALVLALAVPPLVRLFTGSYRTLASSEAALLAAVAASDLLERVSAPRFALNHEGDRLQLPPEPVPGREADPAAATLALMEPFAARYRARAVVTFERAAGHMNPATGKEEQGLIEISVKLTWEETKVPHSLDVRTLVGDLEALKPSQ